MNLFYRGQFDSFKVSDLRKSQEKINETYTFDSNLSIRKKKVFLSHKHEDLEDLKGVIGMLENQFNVDVYIDSMDQTMPKITSGETATRIKETITQCDKFILLATEKATESKWCNWELGFGDAVKSSKKSIALFPMMETKDSFYMGIEYLEIYPYIVYENGDSKFSDGSFISKGYYVIEKQKGTKYYIPLDKWFDN